MQKINKPLKVKALYFKGNKESINDCIVCMMDQFVIVAKDENDAAPVWFNLDLIERLEGVEAVSEAPKQSRIIFF